MANYNNRGNFNNGGYSQNSNNGGGNNYQHNNNSHHSGNGGQRSQKKHSGAKFKSSDKHGNPCTTGWNKSRFAGFVTFLCVVTSKSVKSESERGHKYISVMVK